MVCLGKDPVRSVTIFTCGVSITANVMGTNFYLLSPFPPIGESSEFLDLVFKKRISGDIVRCISRIQDHQGRTIIVHGDIYDGQ